MSVLQVNISNNEYDIVIERGVLSKAEKLLDLNRKILIVTDDNIPSVYAETIKKQCRDGIVKVIKSGEESKNLDTFRELLTAMLENNFTRKDAVIAVGGGVVGDLSGFAASCYMRGIDFYNIPTTLLSQVDSSVGGKTAINHPLGKNMIGAFYQPKLVLADLDTLDTLPPREMAAGMSEVIKYGLIRDEAFFRWLEQNAEGLMQRDKTLLAQAVHQSCAHKAEVVARDERETGERALLNLGHTFGHAIETGMGYGAWLHGEAVAAGTVMAALLSHQLGWLDVTAIERIKGLLQRVGLPVLGPWLAETPEDSAVRYLELMRHDKKVSAGILRLVLLKAIGRAVVSADADDAGILAAIVADLAVQPDSAAIPPTGS